MEMEFRYGSGGTEPMKIHRRRRDTKSTFIGQTCNYIVYSPIDFTSDPWSVTRIVIRKLFSQADGKSLEQISPFSFRLSASWNESCATKETANSSIGLGKPVYVYSRGFKCNSSSVHWLACRIK